MISSGPMIRPLRPTEHREAADLFRNALHTAPLTDPGWQDHRISLLHGHGYVAVQDDVLVGMHHTAPTNLLLPGGTRIEADWIARYAVKLGHSRRGIGTALMTAALLDSARPVALLRASEAGIYQRFGFEVATRGRDLVLDRRRLRLRSDVPAGGHIEVLRGAAAVDRLRPLAELTRTRAGSIERPDYYEQLLDAELPGAQTAVHSGPSGPDGFARFIVRGSQPAHGPVRSILEVIDLHHRTPAAWAGLWRFLLGLELVDEVHAPMRPLDEPVPLLLTDPRDCRTIDIRDDLWIRLIDVPAALRTRRYRDGPPVVMEIFDNVVPANRGCYRISSAGTARSTRPADLALDVSALAALYLGDTSPSALAAAGRIACDDGAALIAADHLFATDAIPWCGTYL